MDGIIFALGRKKANAKEYVCAQTAWIFFFFLPHNAKFPCIVLPPDTGWVLFPQRKRIRATLYTSESAGRSLSSGKWQASWPQPSERPFISFKVMYALGSKKIRRNIFVHWPPIFFSFPHNAESRTYQKGACLPHIAGIWTCHSCTTSMQHFFPILPRTAIFSSPASYSVPEERSGVYMYIMERMEGHFEAQEYSG